MIQVTTKMVDRQWDVPRVLDVTTGTLILAGSLMAFRRKTGLILTLASSLYLLNRALNPTRLYERWKSYGR